MPANTLGADINELSLGYFLNNEKWYDVKSGAERTFKQRKSQVTPQEFQAQVSRARVMADEVKKLLKTRFNNAKIVNVFWTARMGSLADATGNKDINQRQNPTDILLQLNQNRWLGLSAKSTGGKTDIGFKNPGLGTIETALGITLKPIPDKAVAEMVKRFKLPASTSSRKQAIRAKSVLVEQANIQGEKVLTGIRDAIFKKMSTMTNAQLKEYVITYWMDATTGMFPPYVKVTGFGSKEPFTAKIDDPLSNSKMKHLNEMKIKIEKVGATAIGIQAGTYKIMKQRVKWESQQMASSIKFSGEPW